MSIQTDKVKEDFAKRLHQAMDAKGYPVRGRARILSKEFGISDKGAGKWLNGEAIPETSKIPHLAKFLKVNAEWLLTGKDNSFQENLVTITSKNNENEKILITVNRLNSLAIKTEKLLNKNELDDDKLKIINEMIDIIDSVINSWNKSK